MICSRNMAGSQLRCEVDGPTEGAEYKLMSKVYVQGLTKGTTDTQLSYKHFGYTTPNIEWDFRILDDPLGNVERSCKAVRSLRIHKWHGVN